METRRPLVVTGQQIGAGWTPALSVVKALQALAAAQRLGGSAVFWLADEDHDHLEVASTVGFQGERLLRHRFRFSAPEGTATGWLPWTEAHQREAETLWKLELPVPDRPTLRDHFLACGRPLWKRGLQAFSPTERTAREAIQAELLRWRTLDLESELVRQAARLEAEGAPLPLDPTSQAAWFSLDPITGLRQRLEAGEPCPAGGWLSPGAALRPLMQSLMLPVTHVVLGPAERAYWRLAEPLWERVGLAPPDTLPRVMVHTLPRGSRLNTLQLEALRAGFWESFIDQVPPLPSRALAALQPDPTWGSEVGSRFRNDLAQARHRLLRLDRRIFRDLASRAVGMDPERLRQRVFPLGRPQERVLPGVCWLFRESLLDAILKGLAEGQSPVLVEEP